jgi:hypothetical protein
MSAKRGLTVGRMVELGGVSRASFYRFEAMGSDERMDRDMDLRDAIQRIALKWPVAMLLCGAGPRPAAGSQPAYSAGAGSPAQLFTQSALQKHAGTPTTSEQIWIKCTDQEHRLAYVPQYHHDVFISYAHRDELTADEKPGWVSAFETALRIELGAALGDDPVIWFDRNRLKPGFVLSHTIRYDLSRTAIFLRLESPSYWQSPYCNQEFEWFSSPELPLDSIQIEGRSRIVSVIVRPSGFRTALIESTTYFTMVHCPSTVSGRSPNRPHKH